MRTLLEILCRGAFAGVAVSICWHAARADEHRVDFNAQIRPIFTKHCTSCHGGVKRAADISFVYAETVLPPDGWIVEPGDPDASTLMQRVTADDPDLRMPPTDEHTKALSADEIVLLRKWIIQGATWGKHWSHEPPRDPPLPGVTQTTWPTSALDQFVLARMEREDLHPAAEATPREWLRRVAIDLTGLPPTRAELELFLARCSNADSSSARLTVYEEQVQRLLDSPHFGERWAAMWMDLARYADSKGFEKDPHRDMWPYRDWLIRAFNADMPFNDFTIKQLAGDLLPEPTADDLIATAFHRNTQTNTEGGTDDEEFRVAAVIDRINTTWTVWQATTFGCVQCHAHPYDAYRHTDYYRFMAFLNNTEDIDLDSDYPTFAVPNDSAQADEALRLECQLRQVRAALNEAGRKFALESSPWTPLQPTEVNASHGRLVIDDQYRVRATEGTYPPGTSYTIKAPGVPFCAVRLTILPESDDPRHWPEQGALVSKLEIAALGADGKSKSLAIREVFADHLAGPHDPSDATRDNWQGFGGYPKLNGPRWAVFVLDESYCPAPGASLQFTLHQKGQVTGNLPTHVRRLALSTSDAQQWQQLANSAERRDLWKQHDSLLKKRNEIPGVSVPVLQTRGLAARRVTRVFQRGNFLDRGEAVEPGMPEILPPLPSTKSGQTLSRLDMARWLVAPENPLTSRVLVNRLWAELFGSGIVTTLEDFGTTGQPPSHPELLDYLALRLQKEHCWHLKPLLRQLVLSSTYRQTNHASAESYQRDPRNRLLTRGPRTRLTAEMVRDQALSASGLLTDAIGGPSVMPPQPDGVWQTVYSGAQWKTAEGEQRFRRGLYTYWKRTSPYPSFLTFDAPSRDVCAARRIPTNTPLQALVTLNDAVYTECSQALAKRAQDEGGPDPERWIRWAFNTVTQQEPTDGNLRDLLDLYTTALDEYQRAERSSAAGASDSVETAAMTIVANTILNLDKALTK